MSKLIHFGLALTAALGITFAARPVTAAEVGPTRGSQTEQTIAGLAILGAGTAVVAYSATRGHHSTDRAQLQTQADSRLQKKLLLLLHNDRNTANRLVAHVSRTHPDRSANWVLEKVIYDLERDRNRH
ncbi:MAG: hypothetical protein ACKO7W_07920 [Elainella sp.]